MLKGRCASSGCNLAQLVSGLIKVTGEANKHGIALRRISVVRLLSSSAHSGASYASVTRHLLSSGLIDPSKRPVKRIRAGHLRQICTMPLNSTVERNREAGTRVLSKEKKLNVAEDERGCMHLRFLHSSS